MKNLLNKKMAYRIGAGMLGAALVIACGRPALAQFENQNQERNGRGLEGAWLVRVTISNCQTGVEAPPFHSIIVFGAGGVLVDTTGNPSLAPGQRTSGLGIWKHTGRNTFRSVSNAFLLDSPMEPLPAPLQPGTQQIVQEITLKNDDEFTSKATIQYFDRAGGKGIGACATAVGTRLEEPGQVL
jgi:hypothetical protein